MAALRAWLFLVVLSFHRQAKSRQMVWIALALLGLSVTLIALNTAAGRWTMNRYRHPWPHGPRYQEWVATGVGSSSQVTAADPMAAAVNTGVWSAYQSVLDHSGFYVYSRGVVYSIFLSFLLPIWSLSFATEALGGERESGNLAWLLTRPIPRPMIYLAKFVAFLPWSIGLNLGGFALMCWAAGPAGLQALELFWPAVLVSTLAFCSLYYLMSASFRRAAVVAIVYSFFLETFLGSFPGYMKRVSIGFYARCMMFEEAKTVGVMPPEQESVYLPVSGDTALWVMAGITVACLVLGMWVFTRSESFGES